jgi:hypothetical protein
MSAASLLHDRRPRAIGVTVALPAGLAQKPAHASIMWRRFSSRSPPLSSGCRDRQPKAQRPSIWPAPTRVRGPTPPRATRYAQASLPTRMRVSCEWTNGARIRLYGAAGSTWFGRR